MLEANAVAKNALRILVVKNLMEEGRRGRRGGDEARESPDGNRAELIQCCRVLQKSKSSRSSP